MSKISLLRDEQSNKPVAVTMSFQTFLDIAPEMAESFLSDEELAEIAVVEDDGSRYPFELVNRIIDGENAIKVYREWRGMTQMDLAKQAGVANNYISMIERGKCLPSRKLQHTLARILDVDYDMLEPSPEDDAS